MVYVVILQARIHWVLKPFKNKIMTKKYLYIPEINSELNGLTKSELRKYILCYYKQHLKGIEVVNNDTGITVRFSMTSGRKTAMGEAMYQRKAELIRILPELVKYALYNNFGHPKETDSPEIIGYLNFKGRCVIDEKTENVRIAVQFQKQAKFYYNIEVNTIK